MTTLMNLPDVPRAIMFDRNGIMSRVWQDFFRNLFVRVGGNEELSNSEIADLIGWDTLTANRLTATDGDKNFASVANLANWIAGKANQIIVTNDGDGTITLSIHNDVGGKARRYYYANL